MTTKYRIHYNLYETFSFRPANLDHPNELITVTTVDPFESRRRYNVGPLIVVSMDKTRNPLNPRMVLDNLEIKA